MGPTESWDFWFYLLPSHMPTTKRRLALMGRAIPITDTHQATTGTARGREPGGQGGDDHADQDANNGCGNDDDFEDDNNGRCLGRQGGQALSQQQNQTESNVGGSFVKISKKTAVLGAGRERSGVDEPTVLGESETAETSVLGATFTRPSSPPTLGLISSGMVVRRTARRRAR